MDAIMIRAVIASLLLSVSLATASTNSLPRLVTVAETDPISAITTTNRVPHYSTYRAPACEWCGCTNVLEVHHIIPQSTCKAMRLYRLIHDPRNLVTLCDCKAHACHLLIGHLGNYTRDNNELAEMLAKHLPPPRDAPEPPAGPLP